MSWLPRSLHHDAVPSRKPQDTTPFDDADDDDEARGVKEDLSELTETLSRQFWGVASFLAPPPAPSEEEIEGNGQAEDEMSNCDQDEEDVDSDEEEEDNIDYEDEDEVIGVTEEALAFANNIGHHPETWLDFPLEEEDEEGFEGLVGE